MSIRSVLAQNFKKLKDANPLLRTTAQIAEVSTLSNGTLGRISNGEVNLGIDHLTPLAEVYGIEPWQLLHPAFEPGMRVNLPIPTPASTPTNLADRRRPLSEQEFVEELNRRLEAIDDRSRGMVASALSALAMHPGFPQSVDALVKTLVPAAFTEKAAKAQ